MTQRWETPAEIYAARDRFEQAIPGWRRPAAHALARVTDQGYEFARVNVGSSPLPAVVLATVCGHPGGPGSYWLDAAGLATAIDTLAPAEACTDMAHPNLVAWRQLHRDLDEGERVIAVFADDLAEADDDPHIAALQARVWLDHATAPEDAAPR